MCSDKIGSNSCKILLFILGIVLIQGICVIPVIGDSNSKITINPVETHRVGDEIEFSGTTDISDPGDLYIDIIPEKDYEYLKSFVGETWGKQNTGLWIQDSVTNPDTMFNITRINPDGTGTSIEYPIPHDQFTDKVPIQMHPNGENTWNFTFKGKNLDDKIMQPDTYSISVKGENHGKLELVEADMEFILS